jgi:hypothetical protein
MIRTIIVILILLGATSAMSFMYIGYPKGGIYYITEQKKQRKSLRVGSGYYGPGVTGIGSRGFRGGK